MPLESQKTNESSELPQTAKNEPEVISAQPAEAEAKLVGAASDGQQKGDTLSALVDNDSGWDLDEYERKLRQNTQEALELVDRLCEESRLAAEAEHHGVTREGQRHDLQNGVSAKHADVGSVTEQKKNGAAADILVAEGEFEIESYRVSSSLMQEPTGVLLLPGRKLLILDDQQGLVLVNLHTRETIKAPPSDQWRHPESAVFVFSTEHILVLAECPDSEGSFFKSICRFDQQLQFVDKIEAPRLIRDKVVVQCRLCYVEKTQCVYIAVNTPNDGFLYEFGPNGKWIEVFNQRGRTFADVQFFAVVGPVTELLLVESRRSYIRLVSIYNSRVAESAMLALCERAGALCVDEAGNYFVFDQATCKISQHSRRNFEKVQEIALVTRAHCQIAASSGLLAVLSKNFRELRLYRYEEPVEEYTPVLPPHVQMRETIDMI
ncbi:Protein F44B9.2 [Aphelenchoides avenae]|nr:Protein F44B9.2 [Aphelenchus avenae]